MDVGVGVDVDDPMNIGDPSSLLTFTSQHASLAMPMVQDEQKMVIGAI